MKSIYLHTHMGLGDAIILNALIRDICSKNDSVVLFCLDVYYKSIKWMFRDVKNLSYHQIPFINAETEVARFISSNNLNDNVIRLGFQDIEILCRNGIPFYESFYLSYGFDINFRFENFYYERNLEYENYVYDTLNPKNEKYIFIIDDSEHHLGNFKISDDMISSKYKIIRYDKKINYNDERFLMFNYYKILENAEEIHTIETAFFEFIRSIGIKKSKIYVHSYLRKYIHNPIEGYNFLQEK